MSKLYQEELAKIMQQNNNNNSNGGANNRPGSPKMPQPPPGLAGLPGLGGEGGLLEALGHAQVGLGGLRSHPDQFFEGSERFLAPSGVLLDHSGKA